MLELLDYMGGDLAVVNAARCSFDKQHDELTDGDVKLIKYLARHDHKSPFFHCVVSIRCSAPIFLVRQLFRHQIGLAVSEVSRRYVDKEPDFYRPAAWRTRPGKSIKQGSGGAANKPNQKWCSEDYEDAVRACKYAYKSMLDRGIAPEMARMVLPQSMMTTWIWTGSIHAFARVYGLRHADNAQAESQLFAGKMAELMKRVAPVSWSALTEE